MFSLLDRCDLPNGAASAFRNASRALLRLLTLSLKGNKIKFASCLATSRPVRVTRMASALRWLKPSQAVFYAGQAILLGRIPTCFAVIAPLLPGFVRTVGKHFPKFGQDLLRTFRTQTVRMPSAIRARRSRAFGKTPSAQFPSLGARLLSAEESGGIDLGFRLGLWN
jgi:hypothetical protein